MRSDRETRNGLPFSLVSTKNQPTGRFLPTRSGRLCAFACRLFVVGSITIISTGCASLSPKVNVLSSLARHRAESQYQAARNAEQRGQLEKARELYAALQRQSPNTADYAYRMGVVCTQLQDYVTAGKYFDHARKLDPQNAELLAEMGYLAYLQRDYSSAEVLLKESVQLRPGDTRAANNLAMAVGFQGRDQECLALFRRANSETQSLLNLAFVQTQRNEPAVAMATYERVLSSEPGNRVANGALQQLHAASQLAQQAARLVAESRIEAAEAQPVAKLGNSVAIGVAEATVADLPPRVLNGDSAPVSNGGAFDIPVITPEGEWNATADARPAEAAVADASSSEFQLPERVAPPAELSSETVESVESARATAASATANQATDEPVSAFQTADDNVPEPSKEVTEDLADLEWVRDKLASDAAKAQAPSDSAQADTDCFRGYCPVALRDERRLVAASAEYSAEYQAQTIRFSSAEARDKFVENPEWYAPVAGGLDIIQVKRGQDVKPGSLDHACWFRHRLHLFSSAENLTAFRATPRQFAATY